MIARKAKLVLSFFCLTVVFGLAVNVNQAQAQRREAIPGRGYFQGFFKYYQGDYRSAGKLFERSHRSAFQWGQERYLDSVCSLTMMGECHFQVGDYSKAIAPL